MRKLDYNQTIIDIVEWIREYVESANVNGIVVGISGGIDSATTTSLCVKALGKESIIGLGLPCSSVPQDLIDGQIFAENLGIRFIIIDLTNTYNEFLKSASASINSNQLAMANIKPRLRMITNYFIGQSLGKFLVAGTSNRSELAIGYFTKFGDGGVDFEAIGSLYKCEVREIAKLLNIPDVIIKKTPSAGLWEGQTDEDEIGIKYDILDEILYRIDNGLSMVDLNTDIIKLVKDMIEKARHKNSLPPVFTINS